MDIQKSIKIIKSTSFNLIKKKMMDITMIKLKKKTILDKNNLK